MGMPKGFKHSPETKAKIRAALIGNQYALGHRHSAETCTIMSERAKGRKRSAETRAKMGAWQKGRKLTPEHCANIGKASKGRKNLFLAELNRLKSGPKNHNWAGGVSYEPYASTFTKRLKRDVRERDGHRCQICGVPQRECECPLAVHHIDYDKRNSDPVNLITVCFACHARTITNREHWTSVLQAQMIRCAIKGRT